MASTAGPAPSTRLSSLQTAAARGAVGARARIERLLEAERDQLFLWFPVALGAGVAGWFLLPDAARWTAFILAGCGVALAGMALPGRLGRTMALAGVALAVGCGLAWVRAEQVRAPVLARPAVVAFAGRVLRVEPMPARGISRLTLAVEGRADLPPRVRVNLVEQDLPAGASTGTRLALRARLMPPPEAAVPGAYDFARVAWFERIGATGRGFAPVTVLRAAPDGDIDLRRRLSEHIRSRIEGGAGAIAATLATGDRGAIDEADAEAMRRSGLAHLLSISGLHVTAVTGAAMLVVLRLLALFPALALRVRLPLVAAGAGAAAAVGYTLLTGADVPTIRSCVAALFVLAALCLGREAITLRLVAAGALFVLLLWPEALASPSFQLSFAAVTAIVALHEHPSVRQWFARREEGRIPRVARGLASLLLTGLVVEAALMPIGLYHFHKAGLYGALANIIAIPLTTFVVMPLEALALLLDLAGIGAPVWWLVGLSLNLLLLVAHLVADAPGSVAALPVTPAGAFAAMVVGGLWIALWRTPWRWAGLAPVAAGALWAAVTPAPDLIVTGDGRHLAVRTPGGDMALLRDRAGDYVQGMLAETSGEAGLTLLSDAPGARCSRDLCLIDVAAGARSWRVIATRSSYTLDWQAMVSACAAADVVVSDRRLPRGCAPRWLKLDRAMLARTGGVALRFAGGQVRTVRRGGAHPWLDAPRVQPPFEPRR